MAARGEDALEKAFSTRPRALPSVRLNASLASRTPAAAARENDSKGGPQPDEAEVDLLAHRLLTWGICLHCSGDLVILYSRTSLRIGQGYGMTGQRAPTKWVW